MSERPMIRVDSRNRRNLAVYVAGESLWGFTAALIASSTVLVTLLRSFGAGKAMIGSIGAIEATAFLVPQALGLYLFRSRGRRKRLLVRYQIFFLLPVLLGMCGLVFGSGRLGPKATAAALLLLHALYSGMIGVVGAVWMDWLAHLFDQKLRGTIMGIAFGASAAAGTAGGLLAGRLIESHPGLAVYGALYLGAWAVGTVSILCFLAVDDPDEGAAEAPPAAFWPEILVRFRASLADPNFRAFLFGRVFASFGFSMVPLVADFYASREGGGLGDGAIVSCGAAMTVGSALATLGFGLLGDRLGHRIGILLGTGAQIVTLALLLAGGGAPLVEATLVYFGCGIAMGSAFISHNNLLFETCPHDHRAAHITAGNLVLGVGTAVAPVVAGFAAATWGMRTVFAGCLVLSVLALGWFVVRLHEPRARDKPASRTRLTPTTT
jgi:MFS family permease